MPDVACGDGERGIRAGGKTDGRLQSLDPASTAFPLPYTHTRAPSCIILMHRIATG